MEVKSNLVATERQELLKKFNYPCYKKTAKVIMGEPSKAYKAMVQNKLLKDKQAKADHQWLVQKAEKARKKQQEKMKKEAEKRRQEAEKARKAKAEEAAKKKKEEAEKKKAE